MGEYVAFTEVEMPASGRGDGASPIVAETEAPCSNAFAKRQGEEEVEEYGPGQSGQTIKYNKHKGRNGMRRPEAGYIQQ